jgi:hypothetical protein
MFRYSLFRFRVAVFDLVIANVNIWGSITYQMHLYTALQREGLLRPHEDSTQAWEDMDVALATLGKESFFVGSEIPSGAEGYLRKLALQTGASASVCSNNKDTTAS